MTGESCVASFLHAKTPMKRNEYTDILFILITGYAPTGMLGNASILKSYAEAFYDTREDPIYSPVAEMCFLPLWRNDCLPCIYPALAQV
ncbi:hypothetical protein AAWM_03710 [Aspergillus awamori]|uniref:Uncharacterized protein n=1 Tax=Aspergillus awamori TaxID=105351 RepID=A0A401KNH7_ASPAW|nr:hypothetical protein AAWM_03710 [Aspergillus awamori]